MLPPEPPRHPRLRTALQHRWLIGLFGGLSLFTLLTITVTYALYGADVTSLADEALDRSASSIRGKILSIDPISLQLGEDPWLSVRFEFSDLTGKMLEGRSLLRQIRFDPGDDCWVEYLRNDPATNRLRGTTRQVQAPLLDLMVRWVLLPGIVLLLFWLQGVLRLRNLLRSGPATHAKVTELHRYRWINPLQLRVDYSFLDHHGEEHRGWHWLAQRSSLGQQLCHHHLSTPAVIYDDSRPSRSRLVDAECFHD